MTEMQLKRRLAAILVADVVGYTKMMGADEAGTLAALKHHREEIFNPLLTSHDGRLVKLTGDGALAEFASVVDAVNFALAVQRRLNDHDTTNANKLQLRIGVNLGDIIIDGDDIYGDGVNVAARLEPLSDPGGICVSSIVRESVGSRVDIKLADGGQVEVKNVDRPIRVWKWHPDTDKQSKAADAGAHTAAAPSAREPSIAVLPFENMSGDPEQEYFSDGIAEDILTDLSKIGGLIVIARNSSFAYKGKNVDLRIVGRDLGVGTVLEGSIRRAGNRVRITAQLIDAANGAHLWAERYDRDLTDIFAVQDDVTKRIVEALKITLTPGEQARLSDSGTTNVAAHDLLLRARDILTSATINRDGYEKALSLLERAIALDPQYGEAHAGLAFAHVFAYMNKWTSDPEKSLQSASDHAELAVGLAPEDPNVFHAKALVAGMRKDVAECAAANAKALAINSNHYESVHMRGVLHLYNGDPAGAVPDIELAMRVNPEMNHRGLQFLGMAHLLMGNYETAAAMFRERLILAPDTDIGRAMLVATLGHLGELDEAKRVWRELMEINPQYLPSEHVRRNFIDVENAKPIIDGLRKAGVPV
jgi:adenylate cyclase